MQVYPVFDTSFFKRRGLPSVSTLKTLRFLALAGGFFCAIMRLAFLGFTKNAFKPPMCVRVF